MIMNDYGNDHDMIMILIKLMYVNLW